MLKEEQTATYSVEIWKRFRKWGGIPTGITQNVKDLLASREIENIFENSDFIYMLNQASGDRQILAEHLNISPTQLSYVTNSNEGEGLLFYGNTIIPFRDKANTSKQQVNQFWKRKRQKAAYEEAQAGTRGTVQGIKGIAGTVKQVIQQTFQKHKSIVFPVAGIVLVLVLCISLLGSCSSIIQGAGCCNGNSGK